MNIVFASRKVRMGREYYVQARTADGTRHRIGRFKFRGRANDWIAQHAATWSPDTDSDYLVSAS